MSVGHLARILEAEGISTVMIGIKAFRPCLEAIMPPRVLITPHLLGRTLGAPGDRARQKESILAALELLEKASQAGTLKELPGSYRTC